MALRAPRYMTRFQCSGGDCIDTCCHHWRIRVDKQHYEALERRMASPEEQAELAAGMRKTGDNDPQTHALIVLDDDGYCRFLSREKLCSLHARYGEPFIPDACSRYPRTIGRMLDDYELYGSPSCPEVVSQMLASDDAMDLVPAEEESFGRGQVSHVLDESSLSLYQRSFPEVRATALWLLAQRQFPIGSRLFFLACLASGARRYLHKDMAPGHLEELRQLSGALTAPGGVEALQEQYVRLAADTRFGVSVVRELLCLPERFLPPPLLELRGEAGVLLAPRGARLSTDEEAETLDRVYRSLPPLSPTQEARLGQAVERYISNLILLEWYTKSPSFMGYVFGLLSRAATIRFLVRTIGPTVDAARFDGLLVRVIYSFSRMIEHNAALAARLLENLEQHGAFGLDYAASLTRV